MKISGRLLSVSCFTLLQLESFLTLNTAHAGSATWSMNPPSSDWNTAANWLPATVPNGPSDVATFNNSSKTTIAVSETTEVSAMIFNPGASSYTIFPGPTDDRVLTLSGAGMTNNSGLTQNITLTFAPTSGTVLFTNSASAGSEVVVTNLGGHVTNGVERGGNTSFLNTSSAGAATFLNGGSGSGAQPSTTFRDQSTAGTATFNNNAATAANSDPGTTIFYDASSADHAILNNYGGAVGTNAGSTSFGDDSTAGDSTITNYGSVIGFSSGNTSLNSNSTAGDATIISKGPTVAGGYGGILYINTGANAGHGNLIFEGSSVVGAGGASGNFIGSDLSEATLTIGGGQVAGAFGAQVDVNTSATADNATFIVEGGADEAGMGVLSFDSSSLGGTSRIVLQGGELLLNFHDITPLTVGSIEGYGTILTSSRDLLVGANNLDTTFSGTITAETGANIKKIGTGTLTLTGSNMINHATYVEAGQLTVSNKSGSGTGRGMVFVDGGTLAGLGIIVGPVTVGDGRNPAAFLTPGQGLQINRPFTLRGIVQFNSDGIYKMLVNSAKTVSNRLIANGVVIGAGARFNIRDLSSGVLPLGTIFTAISNTSALPISGTFSNLPDGTTITLGSNNYQASYEGGDGNDLTLTVAP